MDEAWRRIDWDDIPDRQEFLDLTLALLRAGMSNSDRMRDAIRRQRKLILSKATGAWNSNPTDKFINEHAWALEQLVVEARIAKIGDKEYRLI